MIIIVIFKEIKSESQNKRIQVEEWTTIAIEISKYYTKRKATVSITNL